MSKASIQSPDVIKDFRGKFIKFDALSRQALEGIRGDGHRVSEWLRGQCSYWTKELKKRHDDYERARLAFNIAKDVHNVYGKASSVDERKEMARCQRLKEEAEQKLAASKKWSMHLDREIEKQMGAINVLAGMLESSTPQALSKLNQLVEKLEDYLRAAPPV